MDSHYSSLKVYGQNDHLRVSNFKYIIDESKLPPKCAPTLIPVGVNNESCRNGKYSYSHPTPNFKSVSSPFRGSDKECPDCE